MALEWLGARATRDGMRLATIGAPFVVLSLLSSSPASADCFLVGSTITCSAPGTTGYSDAAGDNLTLTVQPGTTVVDDGFSAVQLRDNNTITNNGTITAGDNAAGIYIDDDNTIRNNGTITAGADGAGISGDDRNAVTNAGTITIGDGSSGFGIAVDANSTVNNSGTITVGTSATGIAAGANTTLPTSNSVINSGSINVGNFGVGINITDNHRLLNSGTITAGSGTIGILTSDGNVVTNTGSMTVGSSGIGIQFGGNSNTLYNYGTISATGGGYSVEACNCTTGNAFNNMAGGTLDGNLLIDGVGNTLTNSGLITITDSATTIGYPNFLLANQSGAGAGNSFVQTSTGTLALRMTNAGASDNLSADAITARGTLKIVIQNQLYANTTTSGTAVGLTVYGAGTLGNTITSGFDRYVASSPFFTVTPIYDTGDATSYASLSVQLDRIGFGTVPGMTSNQSAVGNVLEQGYSTSLTGNAATFYANLLAASSVTVLDQLSGSGTTAAQNSAFSAGGQFSNVMMQQGLGWLTGAQGGNSVTFSEPLGYAAAKPNRIAGHDAFAAMKPRVPEVGRWRAWGSGFAARQSISGDAGTADQTTVTAGGVFGVDHQVASDLLLGLAAGGSTSTFSASSLSTNGRVDGGHVGVYAVKTFGKAYAAVMLNYARFDNSTERTITGIGATETAKGRFNSDQFGGRLELGWRYGFDRYIVTPFAAIEPTVLLQQGYTESSATSSGGNGTLGLTYSSRTTTSLPTFVGAQIETQYALGGGRTLLPSARLSWVHEFKPERRVEASLASLGSGSFTADGARAASDALRTDIGATLALTPVSALFASFNGEFANGSTMVAGTAGARVTW